jgi:hypothetical protein
MQGLSRMNGLIERVDHKTSGSTLKRSSLITGESRVEFAELFGHAR